MASTRVIIGSVFAASALTLVVACSSTSSGTPGGTSGSSGTSGTSGGGTSGGGTSGGGTSGGGTSGNSLSKCQPKNGCTDAENKTYGDCVVSACDTKFTECYGAGWKTGSFTGPCGTYITCTQACACGDTACYTKCGQPDAACSTCIEGSASCAQSCKAPACASTSGGVDSGTSGTSGGGGATCADLGACCAKITDASIKSQCDKAKASTNDDAQCANFYNAIKSFCP